MIKTLLNIAIVLLVIILVIATFVPKQMLLDIKGRTITEVEGLELMVFKDTISIQSLNENDYVAQYKDAAIRSMEETGIPASIKLAQGILESNFGDSKIAKESNNHFGIKCSRKCKGCTCRNYWSDTEYDMFRVFKSVEECYNEHSKLLLSLKRYSRLLSFGKDYKAWAYGLKKAGYADDPKYAEKLVTIIETYKLYQYDQ